MERDPELDRIRYLLAKRDTLLEAEQIELEDYKLQRPDLVGPLVLERDTLPVKLERWKNLRACSLIVLAGAGAVTSLILGQPLMALAFACLAGVFVDHDKVWSIGWKARDTDPEE